jgi:D-threo-aldose 1-dehydrogenase
VIESYAQIPRRRLGRSGFDVSSLGLGTGSLGIDPVAHGDDAHEDRIAVDVLRRAIELGISYIDTSPAYRAGASDRRVGLALRGGLRDRVVLASKVGTHPLRVGDFSADATNWTVEENRRVLDTDVLDVVLLHDVPNLDDAIAPGRALDTLETLKQRGIVGAIGLGVQNHSFMRVAIESGRFDVIQSPYDYNLLRTTAQPIMDAAAASGLGFINASPFNQGLLAGVDPDQIVRIRAQTQMWEARSADVSRARVLWQWATTTGANLRGLALQFSLREPRIATTLIGPRNVRELDEDISAALDRLPSEHWRLLRALLPNLPAAAPGGEAASGAYPPSE